MKADITSQTSELLRAGYVRRGHGVRGEVRVEALGEDPSRFRAGLTFIREDTRDIVTIHTVRELGDGDVLLSFDEYPTRESAIALNGVYLCVDRKQARRLGDDEWFVSDLIGLRAITETGEELGIVSDIESYPAHDIVVVGKGNAAQRYPMIRQFVAAVDIAAGTITITPWEEA